MQKTRIWKKEGWTNMKKCLFITAFLWMVLDQVSKYLLEGKFAVLIPGVVNLTTAYNEGVAMSMLSGAGIWLILLTLAITAAGFYFAARYAKGFLAAFSAGIVLGGAVGNLIDRIAYGYVVDLFEFTFVDFYIFNVADIGITCGAVLCAVSILFFEKRDWKGKEEA